MAARHPGYLLREFGPAVVRPIADQPSANPPPRARRHRLANRREVLEAPPQLDPGTFSLQASDLQTDVLIVGGGGAGAAAATGEASGGGRFGPPMPAKSLRSRCPTR